MELTTKEVIAKLYEVRKFKKELEDLREQSEKLGNDPRDCTQLGLQVGWNMFSELWRANASR